MLRADVVVVHAPGFVHGQLNDLLGPRRQAYVLPRDGPLSASDDELNGGAHLLQVHVHVGKHARGYTLVLAHQAKKDVFGPNIVVVEPDRLFLCQGEDPPCTL